MDIQDKDQQYIWHPFTQEKTAGPNISIVRGKDAWLFDEKGKKYLDAVSSWWVNLHGHCHPHINHAISAQLEQLEHVIFAGFTHPKAVELSERLIEKLGAPFAKVFFSDNGSTANEVALKMAIQYFYNKGEKKPKIIAFKDSYHGDTFGAMSAGGRGAFSAPFESNLFEVDFIEVPHVKNLNEVKKKLGYYISKGNVAAFIFEPLVLGTAGMQMYAPSHLDQLIEICQSRGVLTIADEVFTGFYRTGRLFAHQYLRNKPDMICLSKGLTGGYLPLGLTIATKEVYDVFYSEDKMKTLFHGHSYTGNPLSCAAACASLDLTETDHTADQVKRIVQKHTDFAKALKKREEVHRVRQMGTILAFDIKVSGESSYFHSLRDKMYQFFLKKGILLRPLGNTLYIVAPYCIKNAELDLLYNAIKSFLNQLKIGNVK